MNKPLMEDLIDNASDEDFIKIDYGNKDITIRKKFLEYSFHNRAFHLKIIDNAKKETYLIKTDSIDVVTLIKPKIKGLTWYNQGQTKLKAGAEQ